MAKDYGQRIPYDPLWRGPIEVTRRKTDSGALNVFLVFLLIWFGIGIYAAFFVSIPNNGNRHKRDANDDKIQQEELLNSKLKIAGCTALAGFVALVYFFMLRRWAKFVVYTLIVLFWISLLALIVFELVNMQKLSDKTPSIYRVVIYSIVLILFIILALVYRREIAVTCEVIREATKTAMFFPSHFLMPIFVCALIIAAFVYAVFILARLSAHDQKKVTVVHGIIHFYNVCAFLWFWNFITGAKHLIFSTSFSTWYWTMNKKYVPKNTVNLSIYKVGRYHLGTVALGSLIITVCQIIKALIKSLARETENSDGFVKCLMACFSCCCQSIMEFIQYVSRNAYIMTSIHGTDFFTSAKNAFNLIMRNVENVIVTTEIASLVISMGVLFSMLVSGAFCYFVVSKNPYVVTTAVLFSLILAASIFSILDTAVSTIFICVVEDYERNDGSTERPYYMSPKLRKILLKN